MPVAAGDDRTQSDVRRLRDDVRRLEGQVRGLERDLCQVQREREGEAVHRSLARERVVLTVVATLACALFALVVFGSRGQL